MLALIDSLVAGGLQVSGFNSFPLALTLWVLAALLFANWLWGKVNEWRKKGHKPAFTVDRRHFEFVLRFIGTLCIGAAIGVYTDHKIGLLQEPPKIITISVPATPSVNIPTKLQPNITPDIPTDVARMAARYLLLDTLIQVVKNAREKARVSGPSVRDYLKPIDPQQSRGNYRGAYMAQMSTTANWGGALQEIEKANIRAYSNRPLDLQLVPELAIPTMVAPDEAVFLGTDDETNKRKYEYRRMHFLIGNVLKQADALIEDMENEKKLLGFEMKKSAEGKRLLGE